MQVQPFDVPDLAIPDDPSRPKGLHVSQIISDLLVTVDAKRYDPEKAMPWLKITSGLALERTIEAAIHHVLPGKSFRPQPVKKDGIWASPDQVVMDPWRGREFKMTWYSMKKECPWDDVYWPWRVQMLAYAHVLEMELYELWVLFVNGRYPWGVPAPVLQPFLLTFSEQEKVENWYMLVQHAKLRGWL